MRVRFFGEPWGEGGRAPICDDDAYRIPVPVGEKCIECTKPFTERDRGVVTACSAGIWGHWFLELPPDEGYEHQGGTFPVCGYHLLCWLEVVFGGVMSEHVIARMNFKVDDDDPVRQDVSDDVNVRPGTGWEDEDGESAGQE